MFQPRARGLTLRRRIAHAVYQPYGDQGKERFDPEFPVALRCEFCGTHGYGPRKNMQEALRDHLNECPARRTRANAAEYRTEILYPRI